jgi:hypothetical protein
MNYRWLAAAGVATMCSLATQNAFAGPCTSTILQTPSIGGRGALVAVSGTSVYDVWAVGWYQLQAGKKLGLVEHFDGSNWSVQADSISDPLTSVSEVSQTDVWAVGKYIWHWDGAKWTSMRGAPHGRGIYHYANAIAASRSNPNEVWAAGVEGYTGFAESWPWAEEWNGAKWTGWMLPGGAKTSELLSVTMLHDGTAWAVGDTQPGQFGQTTPVADRWTGTRWISIPPAKTFGVLSAVAAIDGHDAWVIGGRDSGLADIEHWNGAKWSESPLRLPTGGQLDSVSTSSGGDAWAVAHMSQTFASAQSVVLVHWSGMEWLRASMPVINAGTVVHALADFDGSAIAVGAIQNTNDGPDAPSQTVAFEAECTP